MALSIWFQRLSHQNAASLASNCTCCSFASKSPGCILKKMKRRRLWVSCPGLSVIWDQFFFQNWTPKSRTRITIVEYHRTSTIQIVLLHYIRTSCPHNENDVPLETLCGAEHQATSIDLNEYGEANDIIIVYPQVSPCFTVR